MHRKSSPPGEDVSSTPLSGPNLCAEVATNMSAMLRTVLLDLCDRRNGNLSRADVEHVFDRMIHTSEAYFICEGGYNRCIDQIALSNFAKIDEMVIVRFVVHAYCDDLIPKIFCDLNLNDDHRWNRAFIEGFTTFLIRYVAPDLPKNLFDAYQFLVTEHAASLTPITILNSDLIVGHFGEAISKMFVSMDKDPSLVNHLQLRLNHAVDSATGLVGAAPAKIDKDSVVAFARAMSAPASGNPFRANICHRALQVPYPRPEAMNVRE